MNLLSNTVIAFCPRRPHIAIAPPSVARDITVISVKLVCRWDHNLITGRLDCVWTSSADVIGDAEAPVCLPLAS